MIEDEQKILWVWWFLRVTWVAGFFLHGLRRYMYFNINFILKCNFPIKIHFFIGKVWGAKFWGGGHCTKIVHARHSGSMFLTSPIYILLHYSARIICLQICCRSKFPCEEVRRSWCLYSLLSKEDTFIGVDSLINSFSLRREASIRYKQPGTGFL